MASSYKNLNPQSIGDLSVKEMKKAYSELRSIARKRADRLEAAGFQATRFDPVANVDPDDLEYELARVAAYLRSPGSRVITARKEKEQITLVARGYNIEDFDKFGDFMDEIRYRFKGRHLDDSDPYVQIYDAAEKRNMSAKTLQREFGKYMNYVKSAEAFKEVIEKAPMSTGDHSYLTADNLRKLLKERDIDAIYQREKETEREQRLAEKNRIAAERRKAKGKSGKKK